MDIPGKENCKRKCAEDTAGNIRSGQVFEVLECQEECGLYSGSKNCKGSLSRAVPGRLERSILRLSKGRSVQKERAG